MHTRFYDQKKLEGNSIILSYGSYTNSQLVAVISNILSINVPPRVKVTIYSGDNFLGANYVMSNPSGKSLKIPGFEKEFPFTILSLTIECACDVPTNNFVNFKVTNATVTRNGQVIGYSFYDVIPEPRKINPNNGVLKAPSPINPTVFIIGDFGLAKEIYGCIQDYFAIKRFSSIVVDPRGIGASNTAITNTYADFLQDIRFVGQSLNQLVKKPIIIGHGFGGIIAQLWALTCGYEVRDLILIDTAPYAIFHSFNLQMPAFTDWVNNAISTNLFANQIANASYNTASDDCKPASLKFDLINSINFADTPTMQLFITQNPDNILLSDAPKLIRVPTLIIIGLQDIYVNINGGVALTNLIKNSALVKINTSHSPHFTSIDKTYNAIFRFINPNGSLYVD